MGFRGWNTEAIDFYDGLEEDDSKTYWQAHKAVYERAVLRPMEQLLDELAGQLGPGRIFRPYRDVRFSADKSPYKTAIGATIGAGGYVRLSAAGLAAGRGMYAMSADQLHRYREAVDAEPSGTEVARRVTVLRDAGIEVTAHYRLKSAPRGYAKDHPRIDLLRMKGLIAWRQWPAGTWLATPQAKARLVEFSRSAPRWSRPPRRCSWSGPVPLAARLPRPPDPRPAPAPVQTCHTSEEGTDMPQFMDFHDDLTLPAKPSRRSPTTPATTGRTSSPSAPAPGRRHVRPVRRDDHVRAVPGRRRARFGAMPTRLVHLVVDANDPARLARFWAGALGWDIADETAEEVDVWPAGFSYPDPSTLPLVFVPVPEPKTGKNRVHLDLATTSAAHQADLVSRLRDLGATPADIGQRDVPWVVLADPEGNEFCVLEPRAIYLDTGPVAAVLTDCADPAGLARFWMDAAGWQIAYTEEHIAGLRSPQSAGPYLEFLRVPGRKQVKNRIHPDVAPYRGDDPAAEMARLHGRGATPADVGQAGRESWTVLADPEGNEFCIVSAR